MAELQGRPLVDGAAAADVVVLSEPLSFWGGFDAHTGAVIGRHPDAGVSLAGRVLVMPSGRGSSSSSSVLAEAIRAGTGPVAIVLGAPDPVLTLGAIVAAELYDMAVPVVVVDHDTYEQVAASARLRIEPGGHLVVEGASSQHTL